MNSNKVEFHENKINSGFTKMFTSNQQFLKKVYLEPIILFVAYISRISMVKIKTLIPPELICNPGITTINWEYKF